MSEFVSPLLQWLNAHPQLAGLVTFIISASESVAIIGTIIPGSIMMTALGTLAGAGIIPLPQTIFWAIIGAIVGDGISYWIGHYFKKRLPHIWPFKNYPGFLERGEVFFHKYGAMSVFIGRFVGPVRALVPMVAGMLGMKPLQFTIANVTSAIGWAPAYMLPGIVLGAASLELPPDIAIHFILVLLLILLFVLLCMWFVYKLFQLFFYHTQQLQRRFWQHLQQSRHFSTLTVLLQHHDMNLGHGQLGLAGYFLLAGLLFASLCFYVHFYGPSNIFINEAFFHLFRGIRHEQMDSVMILVTNLGEKKVLLPVLSLLVLGLCILKRFRLAVHFLALGVLTSLGTFMIKNILQSPRPWGVLHSPESYSMPSGHATLSLVFYMGLAFFISRSLSSGKRLLIYIPCFLLVLAIGISRLYLGVHWFTDILAAWLLGSAILLLVVISYHRYQEQPIHTFTLTMMSVVFLSLGAGFFQFLKADTQKLSYTMLPWPQSAVAMNQWWQKNEVLPAYRSSLFGFPSQQINLAWVGSLKQIEQSLIQAGWQVPPARNWISTLHRISDVKSAQYLPMISPQYLDKKPALTLTYPNQSKKNLLVLRLWASHRSILDSGEPIWVGVVGMVPRSYSWIFKKNAGSIEINPELIFAKQPSQKKWQWKMIDMNQQRQNRHTGPQKILLIRAQFFLPQFSKEH